MTIRLRRPFTGDRGKALAWGRDELTRHSYTMEDGAGLCGRHNRMPRKNEAPLRLASCLDVEVGHGEIRVEADLGAARKVLWFIALFPLGLVTFLGVLFAIVLGEPDALWGLAALLVVEPLLLLTMPPLYRSRATAACRQFVEELAAAGGDATASTGRPPLSRAGRTQLVGGAVILVVGIGLAIFGLTSTIGGMTRDARRVVVPGEATLVFTEPTACTIFHEHRSRVDGVDYNSGGGLGGLVPVLTAPDGTPVPVNAIAGRSRYSMGPYSGYSAFRFAIDQPGEYHLQATYPPGNQGAATVLSIVPWTIGPMALVWSVGGPLLGILLGAVVLTQAGTRREWNDLTTVE